MYNKLFTFTFTFTFTTTTTTTTATTTTTTATTTTTTTIIFNTTNITINNIIIQVYELHNANAIRTCIIINYMQL